MVGCNNPKNTNSIYFDDKIILKWKKIPFTLSILYCSGERYFNASTISHVHLPSAISVPTFPVILLSPKQSK